MVDRIIDGLDGKKARDIEVIDIEGLTILADYFVICSGTSARHVRTLADAVEEKLEQEGIKKLHSEGYDSAGWILLDYGSVIVHIFREEQRSYYNIERLWSDGVMVSVDR